MKMDNLDPFAETLMSAVDLAAELAPVPWLQPAVGLVKNIIELCRNVPKNKNAAKQLCARCMSLLKIIGHDTRYEESSAAETIRLSLEQLLQQIEMKMARWNEMNVCKRFFRQGEIAQGIEGSNQAIDELVDHFKLAATREILLWEAEFKVKSALDREDLMDFLRDWKSEQEISHSELLDFLGDVKNRTELEHIARREEAETMKAMMLMMQEMLKTIIETNDPRHRFLRVNLLVMSQASGELPPDIEVTEGMIRQVGYAIAGSSVYDIFEGWYLDELKCAVKMIRSIETDEKTRERFVKEARNWRSVYEIDKGKCILPLLGVSFCDGPHPCLISRWQQNGNAINFVKTRPNTNFRRLIRRIAEGVQILHEHKPNPIAHGHLRGSNILISDFGDPLLADFGLSKVMEDITGSPMSEVRGIAESYRWFAPEVLYGEYKMSTRSDIWSLAMTILELLTLKDPFLPEIKRTPEVILKLKEKGIRPLRPQSSDIVARGLDDTMWSLLCDCWAEDPYARPSIHEVIDRLPAL